MEFYCDCAQQCNGVPTVVSRATYYRHAPFRLSNQIQPVDPALVAAHLAVVSEGGPRAQVDNGDIPMTEVCFLYQYLFPFFLILIHAFSF